jgi:organic radical activating enzyme
MKSATYCPLIENAISTEILGGLVPCCDFLRNDDSNNNLDLNSYFESDFFKKLKNDSKNGKWNKGCRRCKDLEDNGIKSPRQYEIEEIRNKRYSKEYKKAKKNDKYKINYLNLIVSNLCNQGCISCSPHSSSYLENEINEYSHMLPSYITTHVTGQKTQYSVDDIVKLIMSVHKDGLVYISGGEPSIQKNIVEALHIVKDLRNPKDFKIQINSNFNNFNHKFLDVLQHYKGIMRASIDAIGLQAEYIRYPTQWNIIESNILKFKNLNLNDIHLEITPVMHVLNIMYIDELVNWARQNSINIEFRNNLSYPTHLRMCNLPLDLKEHAIQKVKNCNLNNEQAEEIINYIKLNPTNDIDTLVNILKSWDRVRKTNYKSVFKFLSKY